MSLRPLLASVPVVPVLTIHDAEAAVPLARALLDGGLSVLEVTLRTAAALEAIQAITDSVPAAVVGAGTVTRARELEQVVDAGAAFAVSPGLTAPLAEAAGAVGLPFLPGVQTASEAMAARDRGWTLLKLFPARAAGGPELLRALYGPLPELEFCPTGGIDAASAASYLELPNVLCVGGSWMAPRALVDGGEWAQITALAAEASK